MQDIDIYYESIKQVYKQIISSTAYKQPLREKIADWFVAVAIIAFIFSFVPILPLGIAFAGAQFNLVIGPVDLSQASLGKFAIVWIASTILALTVLVLALWINSKVDAAIKKPVKPSQTLSPEQLAFIAIYEAYKELKIYFVSHVDQHIENSWIALLRILPSARQRIRVEEMRQGRHLEPAEVEMAYLSEYPQSSLSEHTSFSNQIEVAQEFLQTFQKYTWLNIDQKTRAVLQALISFPDKISWRLTEREDLPAVLDILENLSKFSYAYLPEHQTYMDSATLESLRSEGAQCLSRFVEKVIALPHYSRPVETNPTKAEASLGWLDKLRKSGYVTILARFSMWFTLLLFLTSLAIYLLSRRYLLSSDTVVTLIVGTSIAGATAMTSILPRGTKSE